ncbi:DUF4224 domain-containing protein [Burkholderia pseudomallei]|uniref:DUF4224 domain-containing protein n=1 Tax=Burkholderia pseudomallei TaxID=28450 RepID=UPI001AD74F62|nr:DUF4224 domain-containing protein [Burkholderia pseudomallei]MBO7773439.1 DUF4224 domain-containing protein [Burkholderia pseudomallei]MBO7905886.1 DUF4224 domain-containing protein [Burkholderia pseudomallei]
MRSLGAFGYQLGRLELSDMFLSPIELVVLTGRKIKSKQIDALRRMGVPFLVNACGRAVVARSAIEGRPNSAGRTESVGRSVWNPAVLGA